ncbi:hypothetical protein LJC48_04605 [Desulfovibrio sp. OttesenSCG-928-C06]|nr:hypothetical protein [Desulfovibrio sp. OttesenSCG-928-C06]
MLFLLGGSNKQAKQPVKRAENLDRVKELFNSGRFPVVTTSQLDDDRKVGKVLGLVACRGFDSEDAFFGMAARAVNQGAQAIIGYQENVAFHPDGSKYFTCYGTAIQYDTTQEAYEKRQLAHEMHRALYAAKE